MRPTISEQLAGAARVLGEVVAPNVDDPNASEQLGHVRALLDALAESWTTFLSRLHTDLTELRELLAAIDRAPLPATPDDPLDVDAVDAHHTELRARLAELIPTLTDPDHRVAVRAYLLSHTGRFS